ncbi:DUF4011 domain-containing protein [Nostoc sp. CHAB 5836]|uniref:DUF4011 domain-containing protein n=1 Tax=Nostoc sp. CHAB 5836 TaxID=2780404 RepID=UPI001E283CCE|nr:DUF4011 domain-containing protein [Nostoc sp. CHAB 5836]MCC5616575.1 DUF4011 domain-containing protein [Nostoc sp. CHAB 5836]
MNISEFKTIQDKINIWKKKLIGESNKNPLVDLRQNQKRLVPLLRDSSFLYSHFTEDELESLLISELEPKQMDDDPIKVLDELRKEAKSTIEDKGFNSLFLVINTLTWFNTENPHEKYVSPILLVPVRLEKTGRKSLEFTLHPIDDDIAVNFTLVNRLRDFDITLPNSDRVKELSYEDFFNEVRCAIAAKQPEWEVKETAQITLFPDAKAAMIQDLEQNQEKIATHPILQELALDRTSENVKNSSILQEKELDQIDYSSIYQICDADSSQQVVIEAVKAGFSCVVQGPPGTGKSQTIVNIITELVGQGKKVLVVAEKQTALEVVFDRLKKSRLEDICLNLHHEVTKKAKDFFNQLEQTFHELSEKNEAQQRDWEPFFKPLCDYRKILNDHVKSLHEKKQPLNKSAFDLYGEILRLERENVPPLEFNLSNLQDWPEPRLLNAKIFLEQLGQFEAIFRGRQKTIWSNSPHFHFVKGGIYDRGGRGDNIGEAEEVAKLTVQHFKQHSQQSLGIITSSKQQAKAIWEQLKQISIKHPEIEEFCQENSDKFFVKAIDDVQGDERDVIFLSFGFGFDNKNPGKLNHSFGYFSKKQQDLGKRRLNVAITRARCKFVLVASIKHENINAGVSPQAALIKKYFAYVESGAQKLDEKHDDRLSHLDLPFEEDIYQVLTERGYAVKKRVGRSAYPIDLVVMNNSESETEESLLGIVCDGGTYSKYPTARDRDRLRQEVLQKLGWRIYKIWSCEWNRNREGQINRLIEHIENLPNQK